MRAARGRAGSAEPGGAPALAEPSEWRVYPWSAELQDGFVWGRGAVDMKSQIAAELAAVLALCEEG